MQKHYIVLYNARIDIIPDLDHSVHVTLLKQMWEDHS